MSLTVREWRRVKEMSQETLAEKIHVHVGTIRNWEKDPGKIPIEKATELAKALGVPIEDVIFTAKG